MENRSAVARRYAARALAIVRDRAEQARAALVSADRLSAAGPQPRAEPAGPVAGNDDSKGPARSYAGQWNPPTVADAIAQIYNTTDMASFEEGGRLDSEWLRPLVTPESTVLDLGCGIGRVAYYVAPECRKLWAVDVSPRMLELAAERLAARGNVSFAPCKDVEIPDVPSDSVDVAYSLLVLQHLEREDAFLLLEEMYRVLRPGGTVMLTFPNLLSETYLACFLRYAHERASSQLARARLYTPQEVDCVLRAAGFQAPDLEVATEIRVIARKPAG